MKTYQILAVIAALVVVCSARAEEVVDSKKLFQRRQRWAENNRKSAPERTADGCEVPLREAKVLDLAAFRKVRQEAAAIAAVSTEPAVAADPSSIAISVPESRESLGSKYMTPVTGQGDDTAITINPADDNANPSELLQSLRHIDGQTKIPLIHQTIRYAGLRRFNTRMNAFVVENKKFGPGELQLYTAILALSAKGALNDSADDEGFVKLMTESFRSSWNLDPFVRYQLLTALLSSVDLARAMDINSMNFWDLVSEWRISHFEHHFTDPLDMVVMTRLGMVPPGE